MSKFYSQLFNQKKAQMCLSNGELSTYEKLTPDQSETMSNCNKRLLKPLVEFGSKLPRTNVFKIKSVFTDNLNIRNICLCGFSPSSQNFTYAIIESCNYVKKSAVDYIEPFYHMKEFVHPTDLYFF